jgi:hypothetical protein
MSKKKNMLHSIELYTDYLVKPEKNEGFSRLDNLFIGVILKVPQKPNEDTFPGDE